MNKRGSSMHTTTKQFHAGARLMASLVLGSSMVCGYSVLTHEAIIDSVWDISIQKLLVKRFPTATPEELEKAHAFAYGGCILQDMGYYPFSSHLFSDLTHYVRSGDFIAALIRDSQDLNEYAFALGSLAHYAADNSGHRLAVNPAVPILYPKLGVKFGKMVTYWDDHTSHMRTEFALDVVQVAGAKYAPNQYHKFIGFEVSKPVMERAFQDTYGLQIKDVFGNFKLAEGSYRYGVTTLIPTMTRVAWDLKKDQLIKDTPGITRRKFLFNLSRASFEKEWGKDYKPPGIKTRIIAWIIRVIPKVGPLKSLQFRPPTPEVEKMFMASFNTTIDTYKALLADVDAGKIELANRNFDVGDLTRAGAYQGADEAYVKLVDKLAERHFSGITPDLRSNILAFYEGTSESTFDKKEKDAKKQKEWVKLQAELMELKAVSGESNVSR
jgi:Zinc dependent phospholipase C